MKRTIISRLILGIIAVILSLALFTRDGVRNVSPCDLTPGCVSTNNDIRGTYITTDQGYPAPYKHTETFRPTQGANYKQASLMQQNVNIAAILLNVVFWFLILEMPFRIRAAIRAKYRPTLQANTADASSPSKA